jgi:two-component system LytT family response regulator
MVITAILVDDEENALNALRQKILQHCPAVDIIATCSSSSQAIQVINEKQPDLLFLDIEMPVINGFNLLQQIKHRNFEVIFVTAYDHYAVRAIRSSALDYLVKPVDVEELKEAVQRACDQKQQPHSGERIDLLLEQVKGATQKISRIAIPAADGIEFLRIADIIYLEAHINYTHIYLESGKKHVVARTIKDFEELLPVAGFFRIHNSYIVNTDRIEKYIRGEGGQVVLSNGPTLDVSKRKKTEFLKAMGYS